MQKLHLVGFTANNDGLIFSTRKGAKSGSFVVPIDGRLLKQLAEREGSAAAAAKAEEPRQGSPRLVRPESALSPREMQDRIRSGWTLDEVAAEAGVDDDWVRRFAAPVLAEVRQVVERARAAVYDKPRVGLSTLPLGASVRRNVLDRGVRIAEEDLDDAWSAYQLDDDLWIVRFAYTSRGRVQEAEWFFDLESDELSSRNRLAGQLGHVARGRARRPVPPVSAVPKPATAAPARKAAPTRPTATKAASVPSSAAKKVAAQKVAAKQLAAKKAAAKQVSAKRSAAKKLAAKQAAVKKLATKKAPAKKAPAKKVAPKKVAPKAPAKKAPAKKVAAAKKVAPKLVRPPLRPVATTRTAAARPRPAQTNGIAPTRRPATSGRAPAAPRKRSASQPTKKPAKETAPARAAVELLPETSNPWAAPERPAPPAPRADDRPTDPGIPAWTAPEPVRPLPPPPPAAVPDAVREAVAMPIGDELDPPLPGATEVDAVRGIARIDSRRNSRYVSAPPPRQPAFRGDVPRAGGPPGEPPGPRRPRRSEPLRGR